MSVIQIFAKPPVAGKVKTRLIPDIGDRNATDVYLHCLNYTIGLVKDSGFDYQLWLSEASDDVIVKDTPRYLQQGSNLGERMHFAIAKQLSTHPGEKVVLIGSDCLDLRQHHFEQVFVALDTNDIVLLPTFDGGFALIGCKIIDSLLFDKVEWSSNEVLQQTTNNAKKLNYRVHLLEMVRDIDTLSDLVHYPELLSIIDQNQ